MSGLNRRDLLKLSGIGAGVVLVSGLGVGERLAFGKGSGSAPAPVDFFFLQLSDTHWGFDGPKVNPEAATTLKQTVATVNGLSRQPDFVVFTGDLTHTTDDAAVRQRRMKEFKEIVAGLKVKDLKLLPGEHDASLDEGKAFKENFGPTHYTFVHKGVHFIAIDNVSDPQGAVGAVQLGWLKKELGKIKKDAPIVVLTDLDHAWANVYVDEPKVPQLKIGQPAVLITDAGQRIDGSITFISPKAEFTPRNVQTAEERSKLVYRVKVSTDNRSGILKPGMPVEAELGEPQRTAR